MLAAAGPEGEEEEEGDRDPEGRPLSLQDEVNRDDWSTTYRALLKIDPSNPALNYIAPRDFSPTNEDVLNMRAALAKAQAEREGRSSSDLSLPPELDATSRLRNPFGIPENYKMRPSGKGGGTLYVDPLNTHNRVRIMPGNLSSQYPAQQQPYVVN